MEPFERGPRPLRAQVQRAAAPSDQLITTIVGSAYTPPDARSSLRLRKRRSGAVRENKPQKNKSETNHGGRKAPRPADRRRRLPTLHQTPPRGRQEHSRSPKIQNGTGETGYLGPVGLGSVFTRLQVGGARSKLRCGTACLGSPEGPLAEAGSIPVGHKRPPHGWVPNPARYTHHIHPYPIQPVVDYTGDPLLDPFRCV